MADIARVHPPQAPHGQIYIGERGRHVFKLVFHGESVSAAYDEGANAAVAAAQAVAKFEELMEDGSLGSMETDAFGGMSGTLCVIGIQSGGDKICESLIHADRLCRHTNQLQPISLQAALVPSEQ